jgi:hypothetical protein
MSEVVELQVYVKRWQEQLRQRNGEVEHGNENDEVNQTHILMEILLKYIQNLYQHEMETNTRTTSKNLQTLRKMLQHGRFLLLIEDSVQEHVSSVSSISTITPMGILGVTYLSGSTDDPLLEDIIIDSNHRHCGYGSRLLQMSLKHLTIAASSHVDLYCAHYLLPFYQKNGFTIIRASETERCYLRWTRPPQT